MSTVQIFGGFNNSTKPIGPNVKVTDILVRGGGGTITFSDGVTVEFMYGFKPDGSIPSGGIFDVTLVGDRAKRVYQNVVAQNVCDMIDWLLQCSALSRRVAILELSQGLAKQFDFTASDWTDGTVNIIEIPDEGTGPLGLDLDPGQIGPHKFGVGRAFLLNVWKEDGTPVLVGVDVEFEIDLAAGLIKIRKAPLAPNFAGKVIIS